MIATPNPHKHDGSQHWIANVEVVMGVTGTLPAQNAIVRIGVGYSGIERKLGYHFHALEDEINPEVALPLHPPQPGAHVVLARNLSPTLY
jgi:hypothetical protein